MGFTPQKPCVSEPVTPSAPDVLNWDRMSADHESPEDHALSLGFGVCLLRGLFLNKHRCHEVASPHMQVHHCCREQ